MCEEIVETLPIICKKEGVSRAWLDMKPYSDLLLKIDEIEAIEVDYEECRPSASGKGELCPIVAYTKSGRKYELYTVSNAYGNVQMGAVMRTLLKIICDASETEGVYSIDNEALEESGFL